MLHDPPAVISHMSATFRQEFLGPDHMLFQAGVHIKTFSFVMFPSNENGKELYKGFCGPYESPGKYKVSD